MKAQSTVYRRERDLVAHFLGLLELKSNPWRIISYDVEFYYSRGCADVIAITEKNELLSFEAKLRDWRTAVHQAYRNRCFSNATYVLLPEDQIRNVQYDEFERRGVGLCSICDNGIRIHSYPKNENPLQDGLYSKALTASKGGDYGTRY